MMNWYNGFDALDAHEYDEIMKALTTTDMKNEKAEQAAPCFENELEKNGEGR